MNIQETHCVRVIFQPTVATLSRIYSLCLEATPNLGYEATKQKETPIGFSLSSHNSMCYLCLAKCPYIALHRSPSTLTTLASTIPTPHNTLLGSGIPFTDPQFS